MKETKFKQVVLPGLIAFLLMGGLILVVKPGADSFGKTNSYSSDWENDNNMDEDTEAVIGNFLKIGQEEFYNAPTYFTPKEAEKVTELELDGIYNENFDTLREDPDKEEPEVGTRISLSLSQLSYFPNVEKLTIVPEEATTERYNEKSDDYDTINYYYNVDTKSLKKLSKLKELSLKYMNIANLSFLETSALENLTFSVCDFSGLKEAEYKQFSGVRTITLGEKLEELKINNLISCADSLQALDINEYERQWDAKLEQLKHPEKLKSLSMSVTPDKIKKLEASLKPLSSLTSLSIGWNHNPSPANAASKEFAFLGSMKTLENLSIHGNDGYNDYSDYLNESLYYYDSENRWEYSDGRTYVFDLYKNNYHDYTFLSKLTNLKSLSLSYMEVTDLGFVSSLTKLVSLDLNHNFIRDLSPLSTLSSLEDLELSFNGIQDIAPLSSLTELKRLSMGNNQISSIEAVRNMLNLEVLDASSGFYYSDDQTYSPANIINKYYGLSDYTYSPYTWVTQGYNPKSMEDVKKDKYVYREKDEEDESGGWNLFDNTTMYNNAIDYTSATGYVTLHEYDNSTIWGAFKNTIEDLSPLENAYKLMFLDVSSNKVKNISSLEKLSQLQFLSCMDNEIKDIYVISKMNFPNLSALYVSQNPIKDGIAIERLKDDIDSEHLQYYMTPYYNKSRLNIIEVKEPAVHIDIMDFDMVSFFANIGSGMEK